MVLYLSTEICEDGSSYRDVENNGRNRKFPSAKEISTEVKMKLFKRVLSPVMLFGCEMMTLISKQMEKLKYRK